MAKIKKRKRSKMLASLPPIRLTAEEVAIIRKHRSKRTKKSQIARGVRPVQPPYDHLGRADNITWEQALEAVEAVMRERPEGMVVPHR